MKRSWKNFKWPAILAALLILSAWAVYVPKSARAQAPAGSRVFRTGPVQVGFGQTAILSYSNLLSARASSVSMLFFDVKSGDLLQVTKSVLVPAGKGVSQDYTPSTTTSIIGVVLLAEPRPDPILSFQVTSPGLVTLLAEPRPDPSLLVTETTIP